MSWSYLVGIPIRVLAPVIPSRQAVVHIHLPVSLSPRQDMKGFKAHLSVVQDGCVHDASRFLGVSEVVLTRQSPVAQKFTDIIRRKVRFDSTHIGDKDHAPVLDNVEIRLDLAKLLEPLAQLGRVGLVLTSSARITAACLGTAVTLERTMTLTETLRTNRVRHGRSSWRRTSTGRPSRSILVYSRRAERSLLLLWL